jgi:hypothetical protein
VSKFQCWQVVFASKLTRLTLKVNNTKYNLKNKHKFKKKNRPNINTDRNHCYTVILVRPKTGESAQLSFASKFVGEFLLIRANFVQCPAKNLLIWGNFAQIGKTRPNIFGAKFNCAESPISNKFHPKKITV